jgi:molybdate transport system permease protein
MEFLPIWISLKTSIASVIITFIIGVASAYIVTNYVKKGKNLIDGIFMLPMVLPPTVIGFLLLLFLGKNGVIGGFLYEMDIRVVFTWKATVIASFIVSFPIMYKATRIAFENIDKNIINVAKTLGLSNWKIFNRIIFPNAWPGIAGGTILAFIRGLGEFGATLLIAGNIPGKTQTIPLAIFFTAESGKMNEALLLVIIMTLLSILVIVSFSMWSKKEI